MPARETIQGANVFTRNLCRQQPANGSCTVARAVGLGHRRPLPAADGGPMRGKRIKDKLVAGRPVFYTSISFHAPRLVELLARSGIDLLFLDAEHGPLSEAQCEEMVRA